MFRTRLLSSLSQMCGGEALKMCRCFLCARNYPLDAIGTWLVVMVRWLDTFPNHFQHEEIAGHVRAIEAAHPQFQLQP